MLGLSTQSSLIARWWVGLQTLWRFWLKNLSIDEMVGSWCFGCCQAHQGLSVWFLLLWFSVLCIVESLSLLYLLFISWFLCSRRWCMDKLGIFYANQTSICLDPHLNPGPWNWFKPSSKIFLTGHSKLVLLLWIICVIYVLCLSRLWSVHCCLVVTCWGKGWPLGSRLWCLIVLKSLSPVVSFVRYGTWFYRFLIFASFLTLIYLLQNLPVLLTSDQNLRFIIIIFKNISLNPNLQQYMDATFN